MADAKIKHAVYKYVHNGEIIYIGKTDAGLENRLYQHGRAGDNIQEEAWSEINASEIYYIETYDKFTTDTMETFLINQYKPKYNKGKVKNDFKFNEFLTNELAWVKYTKPDERKGQAYKIYKFANKRTGKRFNKRRK